MADKIAERLKKALPPQFQDPADGQDPKQQLGQAMQTVAMLKQQLGEATQELQKAKAGEGPKMAAIAADQQKAQAEFALRKQEQDAELQLQREKAQAEIQLKRDIAVADLEIERMKLGAAADTEVDAAIAQVQNLFKLHETKIGGLMQNQAEGDRAANAEATNQAIHAQNADLVSAVQQIIAGLTQKKEENKRINLIRQNGQIVGAEVTVQ
jgi:hypothetical protein